MLPLTTCAQNALEPACAVVPNISNTEYLWQEIEFSCREFFSIFLTVVVVGDGGGGYDRFACFR